MKRRLIFYGVIVAVIALVQFRPVFFKTRAERYAEASAAADREFETLNRLHFERAAIGRGERLEPAEIDRQVEAIDRQIAAQSVRANEAARVQKSLEPER